MATCPGCSPCPYTTLYRSTLLSTGRGISSRSGAPRGCGPCAPSRDYAVFVQVAREGFMRHTPDKREVGGSSPPRPTPSKSKPRLVFHDRAGLCHPAECPSAVNCLLSIVADSSPRCFHRPAHVLDADAVVDVLQRLVRRPGNGFLDRYWQ